MVMDVKTVKLHFCVYNLGSGGWERGKGSEMSDVQGHRGIGCKYSPSEEMGAK